MKNDYRIRYSDCLDRVKKQMPLDHLINYCFDDVTSSNYYTQINQLHMAECNLYYRFNNDINDNINDDDYIRIIQIITQSRLSYPIDGIDSQFVPVINPSNATMQSDLSLIALILQSFSSICDTDCLRELSEIVNEDWKDTVMELLNLSYLLSPYRSVSVNDLDIEYMIYICLIDKCVSNNVDSSKQGALDILYEKLCPYLSDVDQIRIMNRINNIMMSNFFDLSGQFSLSQLISDDCVSITRLCMMLDRKTGRIVKYKSRIGVQSSLNAHEKNDMKSLIDYRYQTDSPRSRLNRYRNKGEYGLE